MRTVKLIFIFILCVGNVVLLLNISDVFGSKQYPSNELSETDKEALFAEMLKDKINDDKEFFNTEDVKQIVEKYNKLKQSVQPETAKETPPAPQDTEVAAEVGGSKNAEVGGSNNKVDEHVVETDSTVKNNVAVALSNSKDQIKAEILELVKKKDFNACLAHPGWKKLGQTDKNTVDYLLRTAQYEAGRSYYDGKVAKKYSKAQVNEIMNYIDGLNFEDFKTWADLEAAKTEILRKRTETER